MIGERIYSGFAFEQEAGYARAVVDGEWVFVSGTTGFDPETQQFAPTAEEQAEQCFANIGKALRAAGTDLENMVRIRFYVATREEFERVRPIIRKYCDPARPAATGLICAMIEERMRVEIEVTAKRPLPVTAAGPDAR